jgi:hypothetical protein
VHELELVPAVVAAATAALAPSLSCVFLSIDLTPPCALPGALSAGSAKHLIGPGVQRIARTPVQKVASEQR